MHGSLREVQSSLGEAFIHHLTTSMTTVTTVSQGTAKIIIGPSTRVPVLSTTWGSWQGTQRCSGVAVRPSELRARILPKRTQLGHH